ncbi:hypothetical protein KUV80_03700 [Fictibacillus nanhaiensis]|uniref:hypothetical protein n=1 Tax=Fictibacillus nanhaiensis TaxID=742169 RepID=UPI001C94333A|nr:hypothetical protein [Fictibacillus nanhaiensis]MBY6035738.1 hypothetical protein [Fictibacillus nanhaiensis]
MYHPSVYDNLKVVLEGAVYDLDFSGAVEIINRKDIVDLAVIERKYSIDFIVAGISENFKGKLTLSTNLEKYATEKLQENPEAAGSMLAIHIETPVYEIETDCKQLQAILKKWTEGDLKGDIQQKLTYIYGESRNVFHNSISIQLQKPVSEEEPERFSLVLEQVIQSIKEMNDYFKGYRI